MWYIYSPKLIICGEKLEIDFVQQSHIKKREELDDSSMPCNQGSSVPEPVPVWVALRALG